MVFHLISIGIFTYPSLKFLRTEGIEFRVFDPKIRFPSGVTWSRCHLVSSDGGSSTILQIASTGSDAVPDFVNRWPDESFIAFHTQQNSLEGENCMSVDEAFEQGSFKL